MLFPYQILEITQFSSQQYLKRFKLFPEFLDAQSLLTIKISFRTVDLFDDSPDLLAGGMCLSFRW